ncbi:hypothetical protein IWX48DRAFT_378926 [Phyllosticta citricarpa]
MLRTLRAFLSIMRFCFLILSRSLYTLAAERLRTEIRYVHIVACLFACLPWRHLPTLDIGLSLASYLALSTSVSSNND